jgi:hypothetical protein
MCAPVSHRQLVFHWEITLPSLALITVITASTPSEHSMMQFTTSPRRISFSIGTSLISAGHSRNVECLICIRIRFAVPHYVQCDQGSFKRLGVPTTQSALFCAVMMPAVVTRILFIVKQHAYTRRNAHLLDADEACRTCQRLIVVGETGSVGKVTSNCLTASALSARSTWSARDFNSSYRVLRSVRRT